MQALSHRWARGLPLCTVLLVVLCLPIFSADPFFLSLIIMALAWSVGVMGFNAIARTGSMALGQAAFMAIGAYTALLLQQNLGVPIWSGMILGGMLAGLLAAVIGLFVLRLAGVYFLIVTFSIGEVVRVIATNWTGLTKGLTGMIPTPPGRIQVGDVVIDFVASKVPYYYLIVVITVVAALVFARLDRSRFGRVSRAMASSEVLSGHLGIHLMKYRVTIFVIAAFFAGVVGAYLAYFRLYLDPTVFATWQSVNIVVMAVIGGTGSALAGPVIGALVVSAGGDYLATLLPGLRPLVYGSIVVLILLFQPDGLIGVKDRLNIQFSFLRSLSGASRLRRKTLRGDDAVTISGRGGI